MGFAKFCRGVSICIFILAFFGAFAIAKDNSTIVTITEYDYIDDWVEKDTDSGKYAITLIATWVSSGLLCMFLYGLGEIIEQLYELNNRVYNISNKQNHISKLLDENKTTPGI